VLSVFKIKTRPDTNAPWRNGLLTLLGCCLLVTGCKTQGQDVAAQAPVETAPLPTAPLGQSGAWQLVFHDEFDGDTLDPQKWTTCHWWDDEGCTIATNNELQWYRPENVALEDGHLVLRAEARPFTAPDGTTFPYTSGMVSTGATSYRSDDFRFADKHVYVEMKAKIPAGRGLWPAFWLLPASYEALPEIDVMEILGHEPNELHMTFHYVDDEGNRTSAGNTWCSPEPLTDWHVFALDWQPEGLTWYLDGVKRSFFAGEPRFVPDEPMYLLANLAVGGDWPGAPDADTPFPSELRIDYIRVWMRD
jgi:beta-glucanase (GH16 family)